MDLADDSVMAFKVLIVGQHLTSTDNVCYGLVLCVTLSAFKGISDVMDFSLDVSCGWGLVMGSHN